MEGREELARGYDRGVRVRKSLGPMMLGTSVVWGRREALGSLWNRVSNHHTLRKTCCIWCFQTAVFPRGPFPHS